MMTMLLPLAQPGRETISWMIEEMSGVTCLALTVVQGGGFHGTEAAVAGRLEMLELADVKVRGLVAACP